MTIDHEGPARWTLQQFGGRSKANAILKPLVWYILMFSLIEPVLSHRKDKGGSNPLIYLTQLHIKRRQRLLAGASGAIQRTITANSQNKFLMPHPSLISVTSIRDYLTSSRKEHLHAILRPISMSNSRDHIVASIVSTHFDASPSPIFLKDTVTPPTDTSMVLAKVINPTRSPTVTEPLQEPTCRRRTASATDGPARAITSHPPFSSTREPTRVTRTPTHSPTDARSTPQPTRRRRTPRPTPGPTEAPTNNQSTTLPTFEPTRNGRRTSRPTPGPTMAPTANQSSLLPTSEPTSRGRTSSPTASPTEPPTTEQPTPEPNTSHPTSGPTSQPTKSPTPKPTKTKQTPLPTMNPTQRPTALPSPPNADSATSAKPTISDELSQSPSNPNSTSIPSIGQPFAPAARAFATIATNISLRLGFVGMIMDVETIGVFEHTTTQFVKKMLYAKDSVDMSNLVSRVMSQRIVSGTGETRLEIVDDENEPQTTSTIPSLLTRDSHRRLRHMKQNSDLLVGILVSGKVSSSNSSLVGSFHQRVQQGFEHNLTTLVADLTMASSFFDLWVISSPTSSIDHETLDQNSARSTTDNVLIAVTVVLAAGTALAVVQIYRWGAYRREVPRDVASSVNSELNTTFDEFYPEASISSNQDDSSTCMDPPSTTSMVLDSAERQNGGVDAGVQNNATTDWKHLTVIPDDDSETHLSYPTKEGSVVGSHDGSQQQQDGELAADLSTPVQSNRSKDATTPTYRRDRSYSTSLYTIDSLSVSSATDEVASSIDLNDMLKPSQNPLQDTMSLSSFDPNEDLSCSSDMERSVASLEEIGNVVPESTSAVVSPETAPVTSEASSLATTTVPPQYPVPPMFGRRLFGSCLGANEAHDATLPEVVKATTTAATTTTTTTTQEQNDEGARAPFEIYAPPGPLGLIIDSSPDGPVVHGIKLDSPLSEVLEAGDVITALDDEDTRHMNADGVTRIMAERINEERKFCLLGRVNPVPGVAYSTPTNEEGSIVSGSDDDFIDFDDATNVRFDQVTQIEI